ncbi:alpha-xenorhabdolysin family binary toxin subunit B [Pseudomonas sp. R1-18]|uniref:alpha-xenorhabdolysin family binary toxin subunit B n=1 Tax=Pseudomonas sp. R1-18 TaxID=1632772 RepID=UPI003DA7B0D5
MNVTYLNEPYNFTTPDPEVIRSNRTELQRKLVNRDTFYLPVVKHRLDNLSQLVHGLDDHVRQLLVAAPVALQTQELTMMLGEMHAASSLEPKSLAASVGGNYQAEISDIVESSLSRMAEHAASLSEFLDTLSAWGLPDTTPFITDQDHQSAALRTALVALQAECADMETRKQQVNDVLKIYDDKTLLDRWTPILKSVASLRVNNLAVATIQGAVIGVTNMLDIASEMVRYGDLVEARSHLQTRLDATYAQIAERKKQIKTLDLHNEQLRGIQGIEVPKQRYEQELRKIPKALETFLSLRQRQAEVSVVDYARAFITQADALGEWLRVVLKNWK